MLFKSGEKIWTDFLSGHHSAFSLIYNQHIDSLYAYGQKISADKMLVKDCIQETFIDLFENRAQIKKPESLRFYLLKSLKNKILNKISKEKKTVSIDDSDAAHFDVEYSIEDQLIEKEKENVQNNRILNVLNGLSSNQKEILYLRYNQGLDFKNISAILNLHPNTAKKQAYRALKKLRQYLDRDSLQLLFLPMKK